MIKNLYIKNFVLIDELNLNFEEGFSSFTGETGAGKSILIDAISLLCAERASTSFIMKGKEEAIIEGTFDLSQEPLALAKLEQYGFSAEDQVTFTREIHAKGKGVARIDHRIVNLSLLKDVLENQIDIHGQRDNAYLLNVTTHRSLLDAYSKEDALLSKVKETYDTWQALENEKKSALNDTYNENDLEYFRYQIQEIEDADLTIGEDEALEEKEKQYQLIKDSFQKLNHIFSLYESNLSSDLYECNRLISSLKSNEEIDRIQTQFSDAYYSMEDAMESLLHIKDAMDLSEEEINEMEERLFLLQKLKRKYGKSIEDILTHKEQLEHQVDMYANKQMFLDRIDKKIRTAKEAYTKASETLSKSRKKHAKELDAAITVHLKELMLPNSRFETRITKSTPTKYGMDFVEFQVAMNAGEDLKPLQKTASGGEISRLMLGLKVIFTKLQGIQTVIFDEIDTGVSGPVATSIGHKMKELSDSCQVFAVTHLAPVAACADRQYFVHKEDKQNVTRTSVSLLDEEQRIEQLALISSGSITEASKSAARELLERSRQNG